MRDGRSGFAIGFFSAACLSSGLYLSFGTGLERSQHREICALRLAAAATASDTLVIHRSDTYCVKERRATP